MPLVRVIRKRGANIVVEANGEILFWPSGDVGRWNRKLTNAVKTASASYAPTNKRPRWAHYGAPLKKTFRASSQHSAATFKIHSAIGSTAPHAYYVDQGTSAFQAKILPPWTRGGPTLYEATYKVPEPDSEGVRFYPVGPITVSGQRAQNFFDKGLRRGFQIMRMSTAVAPDLPGMTNALSTFPTGLADFKGNTPVDGAFIAQLTEWREWRDTAWAAEQIRRKRLARRQQPRRPRRRATQAQRREWQRKASQKYRDRKKSQTKPKKYEGTKTKTYASLAVKKAEALAAFKKKFPKITVLSKSAANGVKVRNPKGQVTVIPWADLYKYLD